MGVRIVSGLFLVAASVSLTLALDSYQSKCVITEGNGIKIDSCDASQFLSCLNGRCMCNDIGGQLFDWRLEIDTSRSGRSKRGLKKKIAAGAIGGAAVGYAVGNIQAKGISSGFKKHSEPKEKKVYSCYARVGSPCVLDYNNVNIVTLSTTTTTTTTSTESPGNSSSISENNNSTTSTTTMSPSPISMDITKIPKCVRNAICVRPNQSSGIGGGFHVKTEGDPRIGVCACDKNYAVTSTDRCEKSKSGSSTIVPGLPLLVSVTYFALLNKIF